MKPQKKNKIRYVHMEVCTLYCKSFSVTLFSKKKNLHTILTATKNILH